MKAQRKSVAAPKRVYGARRQEILDAALSMFNEEGVGPVSTNHIADRVGVSPGNLYYHFRNKEEIIWELSQALRRDVIVHLQALAVMNLEKDAIINIDGGLELIWRYRFLFEDRAAVRRLSPDFEALARDYQRNFIHGVDRVLREAQNNGWASASLDPAARAALASNIWIVCMGLVDFARNAGGKRKVTMRDLAQAQQNLFYLLSPHLTARGRGVLERALAARRSQD